MCGSCSDGFVGVLGPSNKPCYVAGEHCANGVQDGNETDLDCGGPCAPCEAAGAACADNTDCAYSWCASGICGVPVKSCPGSNCTFGQGVCSHVDVTGARFAARDCLANDWSCSAVCECGERWVDGSFVGMWHGDDCSLDDVAFAEVVSLRNDLLASLGSAAAMQDVTSEALNQQASSLSSLAADPSQLADGGEFQALALVGEIAAGSDGAGLSTGTADTVGSTISSLLSSGVLTSNVTTNYSTAAPTAAPTVAQHRFGHARRGRRMLLDEGGSPTTFAPTNVLTDGAALTAVIGAIGSLSAAQLGEAVAGEVNKMVLRRWRNEASLVQEPYSLG